MRFEKFLTFECLPLGPGLKYELVFSNESERLLRNEIVQCRFLQTIYNFWYQPFRVSLKIVLLVNSRTPIGVIFVYSIQKCLLNSGLDLTPICKKIIVTTLKSHS